MRSLKQFIQIHPLFVFFILAYVLTWAFSLPAITFNQGLLDPSVNLLQILILLSSAGPALAALLVLALIEGRTGLIDLLHRLRPSHLSVYGYLAALGLPVVITLTATMLGKILPVESRPFEVQNWINLPFLFIFIFVTVGLAEEIGWRGFALPRLQQNYSPFTSSVIIGLLWGGWHLPAWLIGDSVQQGLNFPIFVLGTIGFSMILTWLYNATQGSVLSAALMHTMTNTSRAFAPFSILGVVPLYVIVTWAVVVLLIAFTKGSVLTHRTSPKIFSVS